MSHTRPEERAGVQGVDLSGKNVVVTGATDGIGRETAESLGRLGARVVVHGRDGRKADRAVEAIRRSGGQAESILADFEHENEIHELADSILETMGQVDVLVNNAGTYFRSGRLAEFGSGRRGEDGVERTFAVNHLGPFVLTNRLVPSMSPDGRIVTVASGAHHQSTFDLDGIFTVQGYDGFEAYARSKFANVLFAYALARRLDSQTSNCLHPGFVPGSALWRESNVAIRSVMKTIGLLPDAIQDLVAKSPATSAATSVYLAASPAVADVTGSYFADVEERRSAERTYDETLQDRLWELSTELVSMDQSEILRL